MAKKEKKKDTINQGQKIIDKLDWGENLQTISQTANIQRVPKNQEEKDQQSTRGEKKGAKDVKTAPKKK